MQLTKAVAPNRLPKDEPKSKTSKGNCDFRTGGNK